MNPTMTDVYVLLVIFGVSLCLVGYLLEQHIC